MKYLFDKEEKKTMAYINKAAEAALNSICLRDRCGSIITKNDEIIGAGFNSPPANEESQRRCSEFKGLYHEKVTDKTCCIQAEQRAITDALRKNPDKIVGSRLYFIRIDKKENKTRAGKPLWIISSKMALDVGIAEFVL